VAEELKLYTLNRGLNPNAQFSVGNLVAFADAAGTAPVDGTGGAPTVTITRTISTPLDGTASFLFTKDAANRQGEGFSTDITLQASDATKICTLSFDYQISTGTYTGYQAPPSFSDLTCWVYDVTNSVMYQVVGYQVDGAVSTTNQYSYQGAWQVPVGCLTARVIWFLGNTGASAFTAKFNNIFFGRIQRVQGTVQTQWQSYTPTVTGVGTPTNLSFYYRRVGSDLKIRGYFTCGTIAAASCTITLPSGLAIDSTFLTNNEKNQFGYYTVGQQAGAAPISNTNYTIGGIYNSFLSTSVVQLDGRSSQSNGGSNDNATTFLSTSDTVLIEECSIPIQGWGANGTLGQDADTRVVSAQYYYDSGTYNIGGSATAAQYDTRSWDTHNGATYGDGVTFTYYVPVTGYYELRAQCYTQNTAWTAGSNIQFQLLQNGSALGAMGYASKYFDANNSRREISSYHVYGYFQAGAALVPTWSCGVSFVMEGNNNFNGIHIERTSGPAQVQAPEIISARYSTNAGQSITNNSVTIIDYEDKSYDDHGCVTTGASWKFTCPRAGRVKINAEATLASNAGWAVGESAYLSVFKSGVEYGRGPYDSPATATLVVDLSVNDTVDVLAGDYLDIRIFQLSGGTIALDTTSVKNYVSINYVGGIG
jgi:hypothetical protein